MSNEPSKAPLLPCEDEVAELMLAVDDRARILRSEPHRREAAENRVAQARRTLERAIIGVYEEGLRRAMGHAYVAQMAEGAEDIVRQELALERKEHAASRARSRRFEATLVAIERDTSDAATMKRAREALDVDD